MRSTYWTITIGILLMFMGLLSYRSSFAGTAPAKNQKVIDFEGDLVEGLNKQPFDSLSEISEEQKRKGKMHLYRKRKGFRTEVQETIREMRYLE